MQMDKSVGLYHRFAYVYDSFMSAQVPYLRWVSYIDDVFTSLGVPSGALVLDAACGTGTMAFLMANRGYNLIGVDSSADMLSEALNKMEKKNKSQDILFLHQDILALDLYGTVNAAYSTCDAFKYLLTEDDFEKALKNIKLFLNNGKKPAVFIFDLKTVEKYRQLGSNVYRSSNTDASYIWKNIFDEATGINKYHVEFTLPAGETFTETHRQRAYGIDTVTEIAERAGYSIIAINDNYTQKAVRPGCERMTFVLTVLD